MIEFFAALTLAILFGTVAIGVAVAVQCARYEWQDRRRPRHRRVPPRPSQVR